MKKERSKKGYNNIIRVLTLVIIVLTILNIKQYKSNNDFSNRFIQPGEQITLYTSNTQIRIITDYSNGGDVYTDVITESLRQDHTITTEMEDEHTHYSVIQSPYKIK